MPQTPNHGYNVPTEGATDWHLPLNANFEAFDRDIEIRDVESNRGNYDPKDGAKFLATDTETVYVGDGSGWVELSSTGLEPDLGRLNVSQRVTATTYDGDEFIGNVASLGELVTSAVNPRGTDLGVGTTSPVSKLHVSESVRETGATNLGRHPAAIENTKAEDGADVLGLKSHVTDPGKFTNFLSLIASDNQVGTIQGNGEGGITVTSNDALEFSAGTNDYILQGGTPVKFGSRNFTFNISSAVEEDLLVRVFGDFDVTGELTADSKSFVQSVDTEEGEKEVIYTSMEAPTARTEASGVAELEAGRAEIELPEHFGWVTDDDAPLVVQTTPYGGGAGLKVVSRSTDRLVVEDLEGEGEYEFAYTVKGTRDGHADKEVVREPSPEPAADGPAAPADD